MKIMTAIIFTILLSINLVRARCAEWETGSDD